MMPKSFSLRDLRNASPFYSQGQPYLKPIPHFEDHLLSETEKRASEGTQTDSQGSLSPTLPLDKCKKRIKLRVNQNFPQDFFEVQGEDFNEEKKTYFLKPIPVKVIRSPANKCKRAMTSESSKPPLGDTSSFRSQNYQYVNTEERESPSPSRSKNILEGQDPVNKIFGIRSNAPPRSKSTEPGSAPELKGRRARSPLVPKRRVEDGQDYIVNQFPLIYPEHEVRSASGMKRTNYLTPRKDQMASFRRQRHVAFSICDDERSPENKSVAPESSHMLVSDSYCWGGEGYNQTDEKKIDDNDELLQALPDSATKLIKSYSRDSLKRQNESVPRPGHYHSASREQTLIPIGSSRKIARILRTEEADNSRMTTTERDIIAAQYFSIPENMSQERSQQQPRQQAHSRGPASFHKILLKSIGMNALDAIQQRQPFEKQGPRVMEKEQSKENESEWVKKMISQKIAEQKKYSSICAPCVLKEGLEFSFSKEYNKQENNDTVPTMPPVKEDREGTSSPEYPDPSEYRSVGSRSQARIKKKFVLIKRE